MDLQTVCKTILTVSKKTGVHAYLVGGVVRDVLLEKSLTKDIDIVVLGSGVAFGKAFAEEAGEEKGTFVPFDDFDTSRFVYTEEIEGEREIALLELEFAGARSESYHIESRKPAVEPATLEQDLSRRDFTINAMAVPIEACVKKTFTAADIKKYIVDPFGGQTDLKNNILKTPLDPDETFCDDPLRMFRAARFAAQLNFSIEEKTVDAMLRNKKRIHIVSPERIQEELMKLLATERPSVGLFLLYGTKLLDECIPEIAELAGVEEVKGYKHKDNLSHTFAVVDNIAEHSPKPLLRFAGLMHDIAKPRVKKFIRGRGWTFDMHEHLGKKMAWEIGKRLRMSTNDIRYVARLVRWHLQPIALMDEGVTDSPVRRLIVNLKDDLSDLLVLCRADVTTGNQKKKERRLKNYDYLEKRIAEVIEKDKLRAFQSPLRGEEIMELCGLKPGPTVGKIKTALEEAILDGVIPNEYEATKKYFGEIKEGYLADAEEWERK